MPLYDDLVAGVMKCFAVEIFNQTQGRLHPNLRRTLQQMLFQTSAVLTIVPPSPAAAAAASSAPASTSAAIALRNVNVSA